MIGQDDIPEDDESTEGLNEFNLERPVIIVTTDDDELLDYIPVIHQIWNNRNEALALSDSADSSS